jgi:hypothetical protein
MVGHFRLRRSSDAHDIVSAAVPTRSERAIARTVLKTAYMKVVASGSESFA